MPIRHPPPSYRTVTGRLPSPKNGCAVIFETPLQRDYFLLLEFDPEVVRYGEPPVRIGYEGPDGRQRHYTPDILVWFRRDPAQRVPRGPSLCEIGSRSHLMRDWSTLRRRLRAAHAFSQARGWTFQLITERDIRTPHLANVRFLLPYRSGEAPDPGHLMLLQHTLAGLGASTPDALLRAVSVDATHRARLLWSL